jgi:hypothetical protein
MPKPPAAPAPARRPCTAPHALRRRPAPHLGAPRPAPDAPRLTLAPRARHPASGTPRPQSRRVATASTSPRGLATATPPRRPDRPPPTLSTTWLPGRTPDRRVPRPRRRPADGVPAPARAGHEPGTAADDDRGGRPYRPPSPRGPYSTRSGTSATPSGSPRPWTLLAIALSEAGDARAAAHAFGAALRFWERVGHPQRGNPETASLRDDCETRLVHALGRDAYARALRQTTGYDARTLLTWASQGGPLPDQ